MIITTYPAWVRAEIEKARELIGWGDKSKARIVYVEQGKIDGIGTHYKALAYYDEPNPTPIIVTVSKDAMGTPGFRLTEYGTRQEIDRLFSAVESHKSAEGMKENAA